MHNNVWPDEDVRKVLTHFMAMDKRVGWTDDDKPILENVNVS